MIRKRGSSCASPPKLPWKKSKKVCIDLLVVSKDFDFDSPTEISHVNKQQQRFANHYSPLAPSPSVNSRRNFGKSPDRIDCLTPRMVSRKKARLCWLRSMLASISPAIYK